ncbi:MULTISPECIES: hypothetical protein [Actinomadura]|uniref:Uncharacterized protein n=1 Tax=Actinomadura madurae TaxID=1993 RepID=A0A1I4WF80_9ACTN|nr:hypothetical protein [Actinomadura madurae]SFN11942.1 hypothetical protein SAMN04489713_101298 [Actinomadura madurae]SPT63174.1 Uncharacterised protein [Actinomadura madurae]
MNELPYLGALATRHAWAEREYARLHADIVEARLAARARAEVKAGERRARFRALVGGLPLPRRHRPAPYCARAAARSAGAVRLAGGAR